MGQIYIQHRLYTIPYVFLNKIIRQIFYSENCQTYDFAIGLLFRGEFCS